MTAVHIGQLVAAAALFAAGVAFYRKGAREDARHGSQGAVLMFAAAAIFLVLGLGLLEYRPSPAELEAAQARGR